MHEKTKEIQNNIAKNLGRIYEGINGTGHKSFPTPPAQEPSPAPATSGGTLSGNRRSVGDGLLKKTL